MSGRISNGSLDDQAVLALQFNQNFSSLILGTHFGYSLFRTSDENFEEEFKEDKKKVCLIERLFSSSLLTMVRLEESNKLHVYHFRKRMLICHYRYTSTILSVKLNRKRLVVCVEDWIFIHCILTLTMLHKIEETPTNRNGVMALSGNDANCYLAYPGSAREGSVIILDALSFTNVTSIVAHNGLLAALAFNQNGNLLATASVKGTVIRVFSIPSGSRIMEFRRGMARFATIGSLTFSLDDAFLVAASNTETVHVFKMDVKRDFTDSSNVNQSSSIYDARSRSNSECLNISSSIDQHPYSSPSPSSASSSWFDWMNSTFRASANYLPAQVSDIISQDRAFACARLSAASADVPKIAAIVNHKNLPRLIVASWDGYLNLFAIDPVNGGEAHHIKTINLLAPREPNDPAVSPIKQHHRRTRAESTSSVDNTCVIDVGNNSAARSTVTANGEMISAVDPLNLEDLAEFPALSHEFDSS